MVDALERIARVSEVVSPSPPRSSPDFGWQIPPPRARWKLRHYEGDSYMLVNAGSATARRVTVSAHASLPLIRVPKPRDMEPDDGLTFMAAPSLATSDSTITVG